MKNKRGLELALSTVVVIVIVILVLVGVAYMVTDGFTRFRAATEPFLSTAEATSIREACKVACASEDKVAFCKEYAFGKENLNCAKVYEKYGIQACSKITCTAEATG